MKETSKAVMRRLHDSRFVSRYFVGNGIDIGCGSDSVEMYSELFPLMKDVTPWDLADGDAQLMAGVQDNKFDFVHSSHCLEHMIDPIDALKNWFRILKPEGHLVILVPDEDLYEMGTFPSVNNPDHKWTFTLWKETSWCTKSINVTDLVKVLGESAEVIKLELLDATHRHLLPQIDQTLTPIGECAIEIVIRKRPSDEISKKGRLPLNNELYTRDRFTSLTGIQI